jgi:hypothetical protein
MRALLALLPCVTCYRLTRARHRNGRTPLCRLDHCSRERGAAVRQLRTEIEALEAAHAVRLRMLRSRLETLLDAY